MVCAQDDSLSILLVTAMYPHAARPGEGSFVQHQVQHLRALGHRVTVVHVRGYRAKWNYLAGAIRVLVATWRTQYDVVHVHYGLTGLCALAKWRTPMVVTLHGSDVLRGWFQPLVSRIVSRIADATIVVSPEICSRYPGVLIPCGVDLNTFQRTDRTRARRELGLRLGGRLVLFPFDPGRGVKRFDLARGAVERLRASGMDVTLLPVWKVANEQMPLYYSAADVMVLCSESEGSPTSVKEALACDLCVVSTDVGDVRSLVNGVSGTEICEPTEGALAAGLQRALARTVRFEGRPAAVRFDQRRTAESVVNVYRTILRGTHRFTTSNNYTYE